MSWNRLILVACLFAAVSCDRSPPPSQSPSSKSVASESAAPPVVTTETCYVGGKENPRYVVVIERGAIGSSGVQNTGIQSDDADSGGKTVRDWTRLTWGEGNVLVLDFGRLTFNGKDHGLLPRGTRIVVSPSSEITITPPPDAAPQAEQTPEPRP